MPKMIDAEKVEKYIQSFGYMRLAEMMHDTAQAGDFDPTPPVQPDTPKYGDRVLHGIYGMGTVVSSVYVPAPTVIVDLDKYARFHPVPIADLEVIPDDPST